jgi:hypothetical protein
VSLDPAFGFLVWVWDFAVLGSLFYEVVFDFLFFCVRDKSGSPEGGRMTSEDYSG